MISGNQKAQLPHNFRTTALRSTAMISLITLGVFGASSAFAQVQTAQAQPSQAAQAQPAQAEQGVEQVEVTGTLIVRDGYSAPTPVTVVGAEQLNQSATANIADFVNTMPVFFGSQTPQNAYHSSSSALAGLNTLNLRDLGSSRTLVLIDGQRSVGSTTTGLVDIDNIPQDLVTRVDVVTGGASAVYGSDALSGVVNFVLDKKFVGTKGELSGGVTTYGDDLNWRIRLTKGVTFDNERGHLIVSGEVSDDYGIKGVPRAWNNTGQAFINNPAYTATNGLPQLIRVSQSALYTATPGGIITSTALANTQFGPGGTPSTFHLGSITSNPYTVGGDWASNNATDGESLDPSMNSQRIFTRASYDITDNINVFLQYSWAGTHSVGQNEPIFYLGSLTLNSNNPYIPSSVSSQMNTLGISQFKLGTLNGDLPIWTNDAYRTTARYVIGAEGHFNALGTDWAWNGYFQEGNTYSTFQAKNVVVTSRYMQAIQAVRNPATGAIECQSTLTNPNDGCVPYNVFGTGVNNQAAINYVEPSTPTQHLSLRQDVWSAQISGDPISDWAGPISLAASMQSRREATNAVPDALAGQYFAANFAPIRGNYSVTEGALETVIPLARDEFWAKSLDLNAAIRATGYTTSGFVDTWKVGTTWDVIPDIRLRATQSRDIRAPNLSELFQAGAGGTAQILDDFRDRASVLYRSVQQGNLNLKPETADETGYGVVLQPSFLPGFNASVDYWLINIKQAIGSVSAQQLFDLCYQGNASTCALVSPNPATISASPVNGYNIIAEPINLASQKASGIDFEASYNFDLNEIVSSWSGNLNLRYLGTNFINNITNNGLTPPVNLVGASIPKWRHNITATYSDNPFTISFTGRFISAGVEDPTYVQCTSNCPAATLNFPTVNNDYQPGVFYLDASTTYEIGDFQFYLNVQNLFNKSPPIVPTSLTGTVPYFSLQTQPTLYDLLGRTFRTGIRFNM